MGNTLISFIDESGNTGSNLTDSLQPLFCLAAFTIPKENSEAIENKIRVVFENLREKEENEIKATKWIRADKKYKALINLINELDEMGCIYSAIVIEKRWMLCGLIVETFFDGAYNTSEDYSWCNSRSLKLETARYYYDILSDSDIDIIAKAFHERSYEEVINAFELIKSITNNALYGKMFKGCIIDELYNYDIINGNYSNNILHSPNYTAFSTLGNRIADIGRKLNKQLNIVFDSSRYSNTAYKDIYDIFQNIKSDVAMDFLGLSSWQGIITDFSIVNSKESLTLQISDVLATSIRKTLENVFNNIELNPYDKFILNYIKKISDYNQFWFVLSPKNELLLRKFCKI